MTISGSCRIPGAAILIGPGYRWVRSPRWRLSGRLPALLVATAQGVTVEARPEWLMGPPWAAAWAQVDRVLVSARTVLVIATNGSRCRVVTGDRAALRSLETSLAEWRVPVERVRSTLGAQYGC